MTMRFDSSTGSRPDRMGPESNTGPNLETAPAGTAVSNLPLVMCCGSGTRLWPASRGSRPKQFFLLLEEQSNCQITVPRFRHPVFPKPPTRSTAGRVRP